MTTHCILERFELVTDTPGNIPLLRRFIIDLAIRGMLIEKDNKDKTATETLMHIAAKKERLSKDGKAKKQKPLLPITADDIPAVYSGLSMFERLANIATIEKGLTGIQSAKPGEYPLVVTAEGRASCDHFDFEGAAAIIPMVSSTGHGHASLNRLHYQEGKFALGNILCAVFPISSDLISARFIYEYLTAFKEELLVSKMIGTANVSLTMGKIGDVPIPIISPKVQQRVDELMALCDRLETARAERESRRDRLVASSLHHLNNGADADAFREHARFYFNHLPRLTTRPDHIKQLRQTILNLAVRGKLVEQDPTDEPATELLKRLQAEQEELIKARVLKPDGGDSRLLEDNFPWDLPPTWQWATLRSLIVFGPQNGISPKPSSLPNAPRAITLTATTSGKFNPHHFKQVEATIPSDSEFWLRSGDLLFQRGNTREYVGIAAYYTGEPKLFLYPDLMMKVRLSQEVSLLYVHLCAIAPQARSYFSTHATGAQSTMPKINQGTLLQMPVSIPPLAEQHRIVAKVEDLMALCDQLETQLTATQSESRHLLEAILHHALTA